MYRDVATLTFMMAVLSRLLACPVVTAGAACDPDCELSCVERSLRELAAPDRKLSCVERSLRELAAPDRQLSCIERSLRKLDWARRVFAELLDGEGVASLSRTSRKLSRRYSPLIFKGRARLSYKPWSRTSLGDAFMISLNGTEPRGQELMSSESVPGFSCTRIIWMPCCIAVMTSSFRRS